MSFKIAREIVKKRKIKKFETTKELSELIESVTKFPKTKNKIFQALRIEVNSELENIERSLKDSINLLES
jgi:16S rRNA (cytosine1402-N4)-methyltransferase